MNNCKEFNLNYGFKKGKKSKIEEEIKSKENGHKLTLGFKNDNFVIKDLKYARDITKNVCVDFKIAGNEMVQAININQKITPYFSCNFGLETTFQIDKKPNFKPNLKFDINKIKAKINKNSAEISYIYPLLGKKLLDFGFCVLLKNYQLFYL